MTSINKVAPSPISNPGCVAEWHPATVVMVQSPSKTVLRIAGVHYDAALYEKPVSPTRAPVQHKEMISASLAAAGVDVVTLKQAVIGGTYVRKYRHVTLQDGTQVRVRNENAGACLDTDEAKAQTAKLRRYLLKHGLVALKMSGIADEKAQREVLEKSLEKYNPRDLWEMMMLQVLLKLKADDKNTGVVAKYTVRPASNLMFQRDIMFTTPKGVVLLNPNSEQRQPEAKIIKFGLKRLGVKPLLELPLGSNYRAEGGDFIPAGDVAFLGTGLRTNMEAVRLMLDKDVFGCAEVGVTLDKRRKQDEMHLDTWFNILGNKVCLMLENRLNERNPASEYYTEIALYKRDAAGNFEATPYRTMLFADYLREQGYKIIPIAKSDQLNYACNSLSLGNGRSLSVANDASEATKAELRKHGVEFIELPKGDLENFMQNMYGSFHCMSQALDRVKRKDPPDQQD